MAATKTKPPKGTNAQIEERVEIIADLLVAHADPHRIVRMVREFHNKEVADKTKNPLWNLKSRRHIDRYIEKARELLLKQSDKTRAEARRESIRYYETFIATGQGTPRDRLIAQERLDKIHGVEVHRVELSGPDGKPIGTIDHTPVKLTPERLHSLLKYAENAINAEDAKKKDDAG